MKQSIKNLIESLTGWRAVTVLLAIIVAYVLLALSACTTTHMVRQSSTSESFLRGDTTVTSVTIRYEQTGQSTKAR